MRTDAAPSEPSVGLAYDDVIKELYLGLLDRPADASGLESYAEALKGGAQLSEIIHQILASDEFRSRNRPLLLPSLALPDLTELFPDKYLRKQQDSAVFQVSGDADFAFMESLIAKYRYYDSFGVWAPQIDLDKRLTAAIVKGLCAQNCLELGCFTGPVLSLLADQGVDVCGIEVSHLACLLAYENIHEKIKFGNFLDLNIDVEYDVIIAMDVLEHLNPLNLGDYISRVASIIKKNGFVYINSPMFGTDDVFGTAFEVYLPEWRQAGPDDFWRYMHCDGKGWPMHGHLVWASPSWWERAFLNHRLVRNHNIERIVHSLLQPFFDQIAPARRSFFVLTHSDFTPDATALRRTLTATILPIMAELTP